jgi:two-component system chemotaxis response regulator CheB
MTARRDIVVIGAACGGLSALGKLVNGLPESLDAAILVDLDSGAQPASMVLQILCNYSRLPVSYAQDGASVQRGQMVLTPAGHHMRLAPPGVISLHAGAFFSDGPSVDRLFETAAAVYGKRVIAVILTGGSHDGTKGLTTVEAAGGAGVVQDPAEALDPGMVLSAIRDDHPNYCVGIAQMAALLVRLVAGEPLPTN